MLEKLLRTGTQVILLTHDEGLSTSIQDRYRHLSLDIFMITLPEPIRGAEVAKTSDTFEAFLARARPFLRSQNPGTADHPLAYAPRVDTPHPVAMPFRGTWL